MSRLLRFNFRKLSRQKSFYLCLGITLGMLALTGVMYKMIFDSTEAIDMGALMSLPSFNSVTFGLMGMDNSSFIMVMGVAVALMVCDDYEQHTVKIIFARGYSRLQFYFSKLVTAFVAITVAFAVVEPAAFGIGAVFFGFGDADMAKTFALIAIQYVAVLANAAFIFMLSCIFRRTGLSIAAALVAPTVITLVLQLADAAIRSESIRLSSFWISSCFATLSDLNVETYKMLLCLGLCAVYTAVFVMIGALISKKTEV